ncbi:class I SAM-dependent methyltransferase [Elusimicrobiota bacterium]
MKQALGSGSSLVVKKCQVCDSSDLEQLLFLGYLPPVNQMRAIGETPHEQPSYPALLLKCNKCQLVQLGLIVDAKILFPPEYPYTSGTTKILRDNFAELYQECSKIINLNSNDLVVDIGSNDGTLLSNFASKHKVQGITPEDVGKTAIEKGIPTLISYFNKDSSYKVKKERGPAKIVTATNVFAHVEHIHEFVDSVANMLCDDGVFISESHYLIGLIETLQYDTIYHEHMRYYSLTSLKYLLETHGFSIFHAKQIPTHGGSIRVYATKSKAYKTCKSVGEILAKEALVMKQANLEKFKKRVVVSKLALHSVLVDIKKKGGRIFGVGAPSRGSTLVNYAGIDDGILDCIVETKGSYKVGKYLPGTLIPVVDEERLFSEQPEYAMLLSWHISDELIPKLAQKGFKGKFIVPLPDPKIVSS